MRFTRLGRSTPGFVIGFLFSASFGSGCLRVLDTVELEKVACSGYTSEEAKKQIRVEDGKLRQTIETQRKE